MSRNLKIIHCLRAPVGGLFRHVVDLALEQANVGHEIGIIYDKDTQSNAIAPQLHALNQACKLGVRSVSMPRLLHVNDYFAYRSVVAFARQTGAQILHGHGAKGGAYARFASYRLRRSDHRVLGFYTPHGGSLHYSPQSLSGRLFLGMEKHLARRTNGLIFESAFSAGVYAQKVGAGYCPTRVIPNGLRDEDFLSCSPVSGAADFLFVGELRYLKGVDLALEALKALTKQWPSVRLAIVGDGPDMMAFQKLSATLNLNENVTFYGRLPARQAFSMGQALIVPSRAESFPYIVLEAGAACLPLIATDVGGIHEITDGTTSDLIQAESVDALQNQMAGFLTHPEQFQTKAKVLQKHIAQKFTVETMAAQITDFYLSLLKR